MAEARAVLVHGSDARWRRAMRDALLAGWSASDAVRDAHEISLAVLLSTREAEAAKWCADPRLALIIAEESEAFHHALTSLGVTFPVRWVSTRDVAAATHLDDIARDAVLLVAEATRRL
jgi:hypothetical protein